MDARLSFVTLAVADVAATRRFYLDGLGWSAAFDDGHEIVMVQVGEHLVLSLWQREAFAAEIGPLVTGDGVAPVALAHNVHTREEVDAVLAQAAAAGAEILGPAAERAWGGYTAYFADPDGFRWEVAFNPGPIGEMVLP